MRENGVVPGVEDAKNDDRTLGPGRFARRGNVGRRSRGDAFLHGFARPEHEAARGGYREHCIVRCESEMLKDP